MIDVTIHPPTRHLGETAFLLGQFSLHQPLGTPGKNSGSIPHDSDLVDLPKCSKTASWAWSMPLWCWSQSKHPPWCWCFGSRENSLVKRARHTSTAPSSFSRNSAKLSSVLSRLFAKVIQPACCFGFYHFCMLFRFSFIAALYFERRNHQKAKWAVIDIDSSISVHDPKQSAFCGAVQPRCCHLPSNFTL